MSDRGAHPTARAFFDAFDQGVETRQKSDLVRKRSQSLGWRSRFSQAVRYPVTVCGHSFSVQQVQRGEVEGTYGTGATVWPASIVLIKYLENHITETIREKSVVELGAGTGIASMAAAFLGAKEVCCTDGSDKVVDLARDNIRAVCDQDNKINNCPIHAIKYSWGDDASSIASRTFDTVLVSDCVLPKLYPIEPLVKALNDLIGGPTSIALMTYEHRHYPLFHPGEKFRELATKSGLTVQTLAATGDFSLDDVEIWEVRRKTL